MQRLTTVLIAIAVLLTQAYAFSADIGRMRIGFVEGDVLVKTSETGDWGAAAINGLLAAGDQIWVPQGGKVELQMDSGSYVRLDENSALQILFIERRSSQFYLSRGHVYLYNIAHRGSMTQVDTPDVSVRAFLASVFRIDMADRYTDVAVYRGYVQTENQAGQVRINAGQVVSLGQNTNGEVAPSGPPDAWEKWNRERTDAIITRSEIISRFLPPELKIYAYDFDTNGRWVNVPDHGYCWAPKVVAGSEWAPYRLGRWTWLGGEYVWISDDPWGWVPYHYGRWTFVAAIGWCWVPPVAGEVSWGPGFVGWAKTDDYVAWVPLAPGEVYYSRSNAGRESLGANTSGSSQANVVPAYKNVFIANGVTVVDRKTFLAGFPKIVNPDRNIVEQLFSANNIIVGAPAVKPAKAAYFMSSKTIPAGKLPPQSLRNLQVKQLKQSRRLVRDPEKSVLNFGQRLRQLPLTLVTLPKIPGKGNPALRPFAPPFDQEMPGTPEGAPRTDESRPVDAGEGKRAPSDDVPQKGALPQNESK